MLNKRVFEPQQLRSLQLLSKQYPTVQAASAEIIRLQSILNLPKGTEHFMSDIHGEYDAFLHILNACSGEVKEKLKEIFGTQLSQRDRNDLATLIYYPKSKLELVAQTEEDMEEWYRIAIHRLIQVCRFVSIKHTRNHVREQTPEGYRDILDELIHVRDEDGSKRYYFENLINTIIARPGCSSGSRAITRAMPAMAQPLPTAQASRRRKRPSASDH